MENKGNNEQGNTPRNPKENNPIEKAKIIPDKNTPKEILDEIRFIINGDKGEDKNRLY